MQRTLGSPLAMTEHPGAIGTGPLLPSADSATVQPLLRSSPWVSWVSVSNTLQSEALPIQPFFLPSSLSLGSDQHHSPKVSPAEFCRFFLSFLTSQQTS